jgi:M6 family metalloprotease-like protein
MKIKATLLFIVLIINVLVAGAANYSFLPYTVKQPDGAVINCFVSGDEYFNWLHDQDGYTIIQGDDGYYYYGKTSGDNVVPTSWRADKTDPSQVGLGKWAKISLAKYNQRKAFYAENTDRSVLAPHSGTMNNIAVYIRFNDDTEFVATRQSYDNKFNPATGYSLKSYYLETSYSNLTISTTHYPECPMTTNYSYKDTHDRSYFEPYNAVGNPNGYMDWERTEREHALLKDAITWINANSPVPTGLNIDGDNDGNVDNVNFIIRGGNGAWAELLWAHRWVLYSYNVYLNGKRVYDYTFEPETQADVKTMCHEMFHALGSPDLYHYSSDGFTPVGSWDLMESGGGHMGAYMKWQYTQNSWISSIPAITASGTYTLHPLTSSTNNCYKIASPHSSNEFFVLEYRKKTGTYEGTIPGSGLVVYRIDPSLNGNADGPPDEVYIYRPGGTPTTNGAVGTGYFSAGTGRTKINDLTNPSSFLQDGSAGGLDISQVSIADSTISFKVNIIDINNPTNFTATPVSKHEILLKWMKNPTNNNVVIAFDTIDHFGTPLNGTAYAAGGSIPGGGHVIYNGAAITFNHTGLLSNTHYFYNAWSVLPGNSYSPGVVCDAATLCETITALPFTEGFETSDQVPGCWIEEGTDPAWEFCQGNGPGTLYGYPAMARTGIRNAVLRDKTSEPNKSKLISPAIDLTGYPSAELKFWVFMQALGSRQDELTVFYRLSPTSPWVQLQKYAQSLTSWTQMTIPLTVISNQFQLAFEGNAKFGFGVCIDDIQIDVIPALGLGEQALENIRVSPNPAQGAFRVTGGREDDPIREITVFDCTGKRMAGYIGNGEKEFTCDLSSAAPGIYILKIKTAKEMITRKLTITR